MSEQYKISLGVDVDVSDIQSQINSKAKDTLIPVKLDIGNLGDIKKQIQSLGNAEIGISIDTNTAIKSAQQVGQNIGNTISKTVNQTLNFDDSINKEVFRLMQNWGIGGKKGTKTFDKAFNEIKQALISYKKGMASITNNPDMKPDEMLTTFAGSANIRKVMSAIANNKKVVDESQKNIDKKALEWLKSYRDPKSGYKVRIPDGVKEQYADKGVFSRDRNFLGAAFNSSRGTTFESFIQDFNDATGGLIKSTSAIDQYFEFVDYVKEATNRRKDNWQMSESQLLSSDYLRERDLADDIYASMDTISAAEQKMVQSSNSSANAVAQSQERIRQEYDETTNKLEQLAQKRQQLEELDREISNYESRFNEASANGRFNEAQQYYDGMLGLESKKSSLESEIIALESTEQQAKQTSGVIQDLKTKLETMRVDRSSIDTIIKDMEELGFTATDTSVKMKNGKFDITVNGIDDVGRAITEIRRFDEASQEKISLVERKITQPLAGTDKFVKQQKKAVADLTNQINQLNRSAIDQNASRPIKESGHLDVLESKYNEITSAIQKMGNASSSTFDEEANNVRTLISEYKSLTKEFRNAENVSSKMKGTDFDSGLDIAKNDLEKFKAQAKDFPQITATIKELDKAIENVGDVSSLNKFNDQLRVARSELAKVKSETTAINRSEKVGINVSGLESKVTDLRRISPEIDKFETEIDGAKVSVQSLLSDLNKVNTQGDFSVINSKFKAFSDAAKAAGIAVTETVAKAKSALANDIKLDIELGNFDNEIDAMRVKFNSLSDANNELRRSYNATEDAYRAMMNAAKANTGDEVADRERLIQAEKEYAAALEKTNNLIKIQARADKIDNDRIKLQDNRDKFQAKIDTWMAKNSAATKQFGDKLLELRDKAKKADQVDLNHLEAELYQIDKAADKAGLKMMSFGDRIKSKAKEYMAYFSVAEAFMYVTQAMKDMFEQVKLIDSAMTELKKVTNETDAVYNQFLSNAASRAKEIGTTIDGLVSSTADFARLGYNISDSAELAEVANIYAVVGDEIDSVETATKSLISTMTAFGIEASDSISIVDKFNAVGNNFAISSGGIGDALERSASSMAAANNSLDETIALITAANTVVQDADAVGRLMPTIKVAISVKLQRWIRPRKDFISIF